MKHLYDQKMVSAIGVANHLQPFMHELETFANIVPAVNQVEFSPWLYLEELLNYSQDKSIILQAYTPLARGKKFNDPRLYPCGKTRQITRTVIIRWNLQLGVSPIPKSSNPITYRRKL